MGRLIKVCDSALYDMGYCDDSPSNQGAHTHSRDARHMPSDGTPLLLQGDEVGTLKMSDPTHTPTPYVTIAGNDICDQFPFITADYPSNLICTKEPKMRRLYQVFIIDLRTDEVDEWAIVATSERTAEFKAFAGSKLDAADIDNYQFVTKALATVEDRIEVDDDE